MYYSISPSTVQRTANSTFPDLEHGNGPETKRRVTDFYFQRLQNDAIAPASHRSTNSPQAVWSKPPAPGVPPIRLTSLEVPKDDLYKPKAPVTLKAESAVEEENKVAETPFAPASSTSAPPAPATGRVASEARRFHLARHISSILGPNATGGIRKPKSFLRPPLATFIEKHAAAVQAQQLLHRDQPIDRLLNVQGASASRSAEQGEGEEPTIDTLQASTRIPTSTFVQPPPKPLKTGTSIRDDPSTWDLESDQLADELAALAMELDPDLAQKIEAERPPPPPLVPQDTVMTTPQREDEYIYETYVRVAYDGSSAAIPALQSDYGILVIDEEVEDLWQKYVDSDDESDWDEEDSNGKSHPFDSYLLTDHQKPRTTLPTIIQRMKSILMMSTVKIRTNTATMAPITMNSTTRDTTDILHLPFRLGHSIIYQEPHRLPLQQLE